MARGKRAAGSIAGALQRVRVKSKEERVKEERVRVKSTEERVKEKRVRVKGRGKRKASSAECRWRAGSVATGENS